jgi:uncharacterized membrane protein
MFGWESIAPYINWPNFVLGLLFVMVVSAFVKRKEFLAWIKAISSGSWDKADLAFLICAFLLPVMVLNEVFAEHEVSASAYTAVVTILLGILGINKMHDFKVKSIHKPEDVENENPSE